MWRALRSATRRLPELVPPLEFKCRIEPIPVGSASIDNELYHDPAHASTWHSEDASHDLATLRLLNSARVPYFDRTWRQQLLLGPERPGAFLEVGCGGGIATAALAELGYRMTGVDPAAASLDAAREHVASLGLQERATFVAGDAYDLSGFDAESFDGVVMADVLEHLHDLPAAVAQVSRVLRPGGVLVFDTINRTYASYVLAIAVAQEGLRIVPRDTHDWRMFVKPHELSFLLQAHGFLCDTAQFRGMAPTPKLSGPPSGGAKLIDALAAGRPPPLPLGDFVEVDTLQVNYLGWALKRSRELHRAHDRAAEGEEAGAEGARRFEPGELARGCATRGDKESRP